MIRKKPWPVAIALTVTAGKRRKARFDDLWEGTRNGPW